MRLDGLLCCTWGDVDSDITYVNGVEVGRSEHQYFSRDYVVPENVLKAGPNDVEVRLVCERGTGRFTPGKRMHLDVGDDSFDLSGAWRYMIGAEIDEDCPTEDSLQWKPLGLYNGMTATWRRVRRPCGALVSG